MSARVLCVGVAAQDFVFQVGELPAGGHKVRAHGFASVGGGMAGTAAVAVARLGGEALLCARLGDDPMAALVRAELEGYGVDCSPTVPVPGAATPTSAIMVDTRGERMIVNYRDDDLPETPDLSRTGSLDAVEADTRWHGGALVAMRLARMRGVPGVLDVEAPVLGQAHEAISLATHVAFAAPGLRSFVDRPNGPLDEALRLAAQRTEAFVCVTDGDEGVLWLEGETLRGLPAFPVDVVDTLGAGDTWHGAFALRLGLGDEEAAAIRFASAAAAIKCTRFGGQAGVPRLSEVKAFLKEHG
ncbi:MAG: PfkB family carbohydrate kinase [Pseudomonadota bacterium]